jgi:antirestriction protein
MTTEPKTHKDQSLTTMTVDDAVTLSSCPKHGSCAPKCRHCAATAEEVEAARRWIAIHPGSVDAWRAQRLGEIVTIVRTWEACSVHGSGTWMVRSVGGCEADAVVADLSREQAEAVAEAHNAEREQAMVVLDWFAGV